VHQTSFFPREHNSKFWPTEGYDPDRGTAIAWDPSLRLKALDEARIACDVLLPDDLNANDPPWGAGLAYAAVADGTVEYPPELVRAGARAFNRWMADFCSAAPHRLRGLTILGTLDDVVWCTEEVQRAYESGLTTGVMLPLEYYLPAYHHPRYDILWQTLSELQLPVVSHIGKGFPSYLGDDPWVQRFMFMHELMWYTQRPVWSMIMGGVLERFPDLRLAVAEAGVQWVAPLLRSLDGALTMWPELQADRDGPRRVTLSMKPSEYWQRQCSVTHSTSQVRSDFEGDAYDGVPNMVFGADLAHPEGWWPVYGWPEPFSKGQPQSLLDEPVVPARDVGRYLWQGLPAEKMLPYLETRFFAIYRNVDPGALDETVARIGPTPGELGLV
jgi:predicted TIM-barrel fold metal-dependent hydrolase